MSNGQQPHLTEDEFNAAAARLDELVREFEALPYPAVREQIFEALQAVDTIHREAIGRLLSLIIADGQTQIVERAVKDPIVHTLLVLYDLVASDELPEVPTPQNTSNFVPLDQLVPIRHVNKPVFTTVARVADVPPGTMKAVETEKLWVLLANIGGEIYAVRDNCPGSAAPLHLGAFTPPIVVCPWHNEAFDVRTGKRADGESGASLSVLPVSLSDGDIRLALDTAPSAIAARA